MAENAMDSSKDEVDFSVVTSFVLSAFDHSLIIAMNNKMSVSGVAMEECNHEQLKTNRFCPTNITILSFPVSVELPGSPFVSNADANPDTGARVPKGIGVHGIERAKDTMRN